MKIYTRTGDDGSTGLIGGDRVSKSDPRIDCTGALDELNAAVGIAAVTAESQLQNDLRQVQCDLFVLGSHLATPEQSPHATGLPPLEETIIQRLEMQIDAVEAQLPPLRNFILPGGCETAARLHFARTVCRRAERVLVGYAQDRPVPTIAVTYLNRLSDWLFTQARSANLAAGVPDIPWICP